LSDPLALRPYFESQFSPARIESYTEETFTGGVGPGAILTWEISIPPANTKSGFRSTIVVINDWAVHIDAFGPKATIMTHDTTVRRIATSFAWE
jgi:hypothetical protein